jgi:hypothetical protein
MSAIPIWQDDPLWRGRDGQWAGHWIGAETAPKPPAPDQAEWVPAGRGFSRVLFRREFRLDAVPAVVPLRLTADSRFVLWVNGREVGRGPVRAQPRRWRYESYDIAPFLQPGRNVIAMLVSYYGRATSWWYPAALEGGINGDACLVVEADLGDSVLVSDSSWKVLRSTAWSSLPYFGVPSEILDARLLPAGWQQPGFDDQGWLAATILTAGHWGGLARSRPPVSPFGKLLPRPVARLGGDLLRPAAVLDARITARPAWQSIHPAARVLESMRSSPGEPVPARLPLATSIGADQALNVVIDLGRMTAGFVEVEIDAPAGTVVDLGYREKATAADYQTAGARYICPGGPAVYSAIELAGLRYLQIAAYADQAVKLTIGGVLVREHVYPRTGRAYFAGEDQELNRVYRAGTRTVQLNSFDAYTDCPTREQRSWIGDGVVHQMVHLTTNEDWRLAAHYVELADSPRSDGLLPLSVAGEFEHYQGFTIPDWSLHWIHGVHNLYRYTGDRDRLGPYLPTIERILRWYETYVDDYGTLSHVPEWNLVDWASVFTTGRSSIVSALWARGLTEYAELSDWVGNSGSARWARERHAAVAAHFEDFWDSRRNLYLDHIVDGQRMPAASQAASAAAIVAGLAPRGRWPAIAEAMTDPSTLVIRSWNGGDSPAATRKEADRLRGVQRIDWDVEREVVRAEPFFSYVVHDAVALAGLADRLIDLVRDWSVFLRDGYDTFGECWGWGTPVHGWSSTPTRDLIVHVLGISPAEPGFTKVRIAPRPGQLRRVSGAAPTPHGLVEVAVTGDEVALISPVPVHFVHPTGRTAELPAGKHRLRFEAHPTLMRKR